MCWFAVRKRQPIDRNRETRLSLDTWNSPNPAILMFPATTPMRAPTCIHRDSTRSAVQRFPCHAAFTETFCCANSCTHEMCTPYVHIYLLFIHMFIYTYMFIILEGTELLYHIHADAMLASTHP